MNTIINYEMFFIDLKQVYLVSVGFKQIYFRQEVEMLSFVNELFNCRMKRAISTRKAQMELSNVN